MIYFFALFKDRDSGKEPHEQEDARCKEAQGANECCPVPPGRDVRAPGRWQEIASQADHNNYEALQPHADVDDDRNAPQHRHIPSYSAGPQRLRYCNVAKDQERVGEAIWTRDAVPIHEALEFVAAVPGEERFLGVSVSNNQSRPEHYLR